MKKNTTFKLLFILIPTLFFIKASVLGLFITPLWDIPDEPGHIAYIQEITEEHKFPKKGISKIKEEITKILLDYRFIQSYLKIEDDKQGIIRIYLKYDEDEKSVIKSLKRVSKPGLKKYVKSNEIPRVLNNLGIAIMSTSKGVVTDREARQNGVGGEVLCYIW